VWSLLSFSLPQAIRLKKNHAPLPQAERGAAGLIPRFMDYRRVAWLFTPGAHFLSVIVKYRIIQAVAYLIVFFFAYRIVLFVAYHITLFVAYRIVLFVPYHPFHRVSYCPFRRVTYLLVNFLNYCILYRSNNLELGQTLSRFGGPKSQPVVRSTRNKPKRQNAKKQTSEINIGQWYLFRNHSERNTLWLHSDSSRRKRRSNSVSPVQIIEEAISDLRKSVRQNVETQFIRVYFTEPEFHLNIVLVRISIQQPFY